MRCSVDGFDYLFSSRLPNGAEKSTQFLLVRLLLGTAQLSRTGHSVSQNIDHSSWPSSKQKKTGAVAFNSYLATYSISQSPASFVKETTLDNRKLFQDVLAEFSNYFAEKDRGSHTAAFVYLYRTLERLSFSAPLLYCATSTDFENTFNDLKDLFKEGGSGDLGLLKKFIGQGNLIDPLILDATYTIDFSGVTSNGQRFYNTVTTRSKAFHSSDPTRLQLEIKYRAVIDLFVMVRNRYFHFRSGDGQSNISNRDLHNADDFFAVMNNLFCDFLGLLTLHIIAWKYRA